MKTGRNFIRNKGYFTNVEIFVITILFFIAIGMVIEIARFNRENKEHLKQNAHPIK